MVLVINKKQGTEWDVTDPAMLKRMKADPEHYVVKDIPDNAQGKGPVNAVKVEEKQPAKAGKKILMGIYELARWI